MANKTIKLNSPPGYGPIVPLDKQRHAGMGLKPGPGYGWCRAVNAVFLSAAEMPRAALDYPIAFLRDERSGEFVPVAVLGMQRDQNLFVDAAGAWREHAYVPAYLRRFPFCMADIPSADGHEARHLVCVQESELAPSDKPLFDARGEPTAAFAPIMQLLNAVEDARRQTRVLAKRLEALDLLAPFDAVAVPKNGRQMRLQGLHRVDEQKLQKIPGRDLRLLLRRGELRAIYAHLVSLENFARLMDMTPAK